MSGRPAKVKTSVCWFAPLQLLRTAQQVAIATVFGQNADARVIEALARPLAGTTLGPGTDPRRTPGIHDYSEKHTPFWIDYSPTQATDGTRLTRLPTTLLSRR